MAVVIIGGRYGSPASGETQDEFEKYLSVTHKEFNTAVNQTLPIFVFVEENVYAEYWTYKKNKERIEERKTEVIFAHADNVNVYRFIDKIFALSKISITPFKEINDIKITLKKQWADMFKKFLFSKRNFQPIKELKPSIEEMYSSIKEMEIMLQEVGKKVVGERTDDFFKIQKEQKIESVANRIASSFEFVTRISNENEIKKYLCVFIDKLILASENNLLENPFSDDTDDLQNFYELFAHEDVVVSNVKAHLKYDEMIFEVIKQEKSAVVDRLLEKEYLRKMKFID